MKFSGQKAPEIESSINRHHRASLAWALSRLRQGIPAPPGAPRVLKSKMHLGRPAAGRLARWGRRYPRRATALAAGAAGFSWLFVASGRSGGFLKPVQAAVSGQAAGPAGCSAPLANGGSTFDFSLPAILNPADWIGWVFGQLCRAVAGAFFTVANFAVQWGSGCNSTGGTGVDFFRRTPNYIVLDASRDWQYYFYDGQFIGLAILVQFLWMVFSFIWQRKAGSQELGPETIITRTAAGVALVSLSAPLLEWSIELCNDFNSLFSDGLTLFQANSFQIDEKANIFNVILSMGAAGIAILLVMQMATRYIYIMFLSFIFPVAAILWTNPGTQGYARLFFGSWFATIFVQPLQLGVLYITSAAKDGARVDTSMAMLFGICGGFLALGLPRIVNSTLGGSIPIGGRGLVFSTLLIGRSAAGLIGGAARTGGGTGPSRPAGGSNFGGPRTGGGGGGGSGNGGHSDGSGGAAPAYGGAAGPAASTSASSSSPVYVSPGGSLRGAGPGAAAGRPRSAAEAEAGSLAPGGSAAWSRPNQAALAGFNSAGGGQALAGSGTNITPAGPGEFGRPGRPPAHMYPAAGAEPAAVPAAPSLPLSSPVYSASGPGLSDPPAEGSPALPSGSHGQDETALEAAGPDHPPAIQPLSIKIGRARAVQARLREQDQAQVGPESEAPGAGHPEHGTGGNPASAASAASGPPASVSNNPNRGKGPPPQTPSTG